MHVWRRINVKPLSVADIPYLCGGIFPDLEFDGCPCASVQHIPDAGRVKGGGLIFFPPPLISRPDGALLQSGRGVLGVCLRCDGRWQGRGAGDPAGSPRANNPPLCPGSGDTFR